MIFDPAELSRRQPYVIADFLRPLPRQNHATTSMQNHIARRLASWLSPALRAVFGKAPEVGVWNDGQPDSLPAAAIYAGHDIDPSTVGWTWLYRREPNDGDLALMGPILADRLVIGFELSPFLRTLLDRLGTPYISLAIHPLRFMQDYKFMLESNFADMARLRHLAVTPDSIAFAAQLREAELMRSTPLGLDENAAVLFGQVEVDAALIRPQGGLISLQEHMDGIADLSRRFDRIYFKPHPYGDRIEQQVALLRHIENLTITQANPYRLIVDQNVQAVSALTSSVLSEAICFGKTPVPLSDLWRNSAEVPAYGLEVLSAPFWRTLLGAADPVRPMPSIEAAVSLRDLLGIQWEVTGGQSRMLPLAQKQGFGINRPANAFCTGTGWYDPAKDHRWSDGRGSRLAFRVPVSRTVPLRMRLELSGMANAASPIGLQLRCGQQICAETVLTNSGVVTLTMDLPRTAISALGEVEVELVTDRANSPNAIHKLADRRALSVALHSIQIEPVQPGWPLEIGAWLSPAQVGRAPLLLPVGWHGVEPSGVWMNGRRARIAFHLPETPDGDLVLRLADVRAFLSDLLPVNSLVVTLGGAAVLNHRFRLGEPGDLGVGGIDLEVPVPRSAIVTANGAIQVELTLTGAHSPLAANYNTDRRELGVMIGSLSIDTAFRRLSGQPARHVTNVIGPFNIHTGLAVMTRGCLQSLGAALLADPGGLPPQAELPPRGVNFNNSLHKDEESGLVEHAAAGSRVNIFVGDVTRIERIVQQNGNALLKGRYNICYGAWELEQMPSYLADTRNIDEYWGLSTFIADAARARMDVPVHAFPLPVRMHYPDVLAPRSRFGIPEDRFAFLFAFSIDSTMARKNPGAVLDAFRLAFPDPATPVSLVVKSMVRQASAQNREAFAAFKALTAQDARVVLIEDTLSADDNASLYMQCDAYVSLHRAEGFGLTIAEAMGYGKPAIATGYSGNLDFMTPDNSCLVRYDRVRMEDGAYHNQRQFWAEPDVGDAASYMRRVFEDPVFRERIARAGKRTIHEDFSLEAVGLRQLRRLREIHGDLA